MWEVAEYLEDDGTVFNSYSSQSIADAEEFEVTSCSESSFLENECALALLELAHSFVFSSYGSCDDFDTGLRSRPKPVAVPSGQAVAPHSLPMSAVSNTVLHLKAFSALISGTSNDCSVIELDHSYAGKKYFPILDSSDDGIKNSSTISSNETKVRSRRRFVESPVAAISNVVQGVESGLPSQGEMAGESALAPVGKRTTEFALPHSRAKPRHPLSSGSKKEYLESSILGLSEKAAGRNGRRFRGKRKALSRPKPAKTRRARERPDHAAYCPPKYIKCK